MKKKSSEKPETEDERFFRGWLCALLVMEMLSCLNFKPSGATKRLRTVSLLAVSGHEEPSWGAATCWASAGGWRGRHHAEGREKGGRRNVVGRQQEDWGRNRNEKETRTDGRKR